MTTSEKGYSQYKRIYLRDFKAYHCTKWVSVARYKWLLNDGQHWFCGKCMKCKRKKNIMIYCLKYKFITKIIQGRKLLWTWKKCLKIVYFLYRNVLLYIGICLANLTARFTCPRILLYPFLLLTFLLLSTVNSAPSSSLASWPNKKHKIIGGYKMCVLTNQYRMKNWL